MFMPVFVLGFPLLGPEYPLEGAAAAIGVALLTQAFGVGSGLIAYLKRRLIDFRLAAGFTVVAVPAAIAGALASHAIRDELLLSAYGILMLILTFILFRTHRPVEPANSTVGAAWVREPPSNFSVARKDSDGRVYHYNRCSPGLYGTPITGLGGFLAGLLSVGIGEVAMPQLVRRCAIPLPVACATSIAIVFVTIASASFTHITALISAGGMSAVPWELVMYMVPGVIIGGQIGPRIQGPVDSRLMEKIIAMVFGLIAISMLWIVFKG